MCEWQVGDILYHEVRNADRREIVGIGEDGLTWRYVGSVTYERFDGEPNIHESHDTDDPFLSSENGWRKIKRKGLYSEEYQRLSPPEKLAYLRGRAGLVSDVSPHVQRETMASSRATPTDVSTMAGSVSGRLDTGGQNGQ